MAYFNVKMPEVDGNFDWDDIDVGNNSLDHSENFFGKFLKGYERGWNKMRHDFYSISAMKHYEHERLEDIEQLQKEMGKKINEEYTVMSSLI